MIEARCGLTGEREKLASSPFCQCFSVRFTETACYTEQRRQMKGLHKPQILCWALACWSWVNLPRISFSPDPYMYCSCQLCQPTPKNRDFWHFQRRYNACSYDSYVIINKCAHIHSHAHKHIFLLASICISYVSILRHMIPYVCLYLCT